MGTTDDKADGTQGAAGGGTPPATTTGTGAAPAATSGTAPATTEAVKKAKVEGFTTVIFRGTASKTEQTKYLRAEDSEGKVHDHGIGDTFEIRDEVLTNLRGLGFLFDIAANQ